MSRSERHARKGRKKWFVIIPLAIILVLILGVGTYAFSIYGNLKSTVNDKMHEPVDSIDTKVGKKKLKSKKPLNILLIGSDARPGEKGRSDALMVLSLDPKHDKLQIVSIPRDTRTEIVGRGTTDKINHAYAYGGSDMSVATVENLLDIEMDYYVRINMDGFQELVNELGTIEVDNEIEWDDGKYHFTKGPTEMDGDKTMHFVQMRKQDPDGDFGRTKRQRKVLEGIVNRGASVGSVTKIGSLVDILGDNMSTNLDFDDMKKIFQDYRNTRKNMTDYQLKGQGTNIDGIYYLQVSDEEIQKVHDMITDIRD